MDPIKQENPVIKPKNITNLTSAGSSPSSFGNTILQGCNHNNNINSDFFTVYILTESERVLIKNR